MERDARDWSGMTCEDGSDDIERKAPFHRVDIESSRVVEERIMTDRQALDINLEAFRSGGGSRWIRFGDYGDPLDHPLLDPNEPVGTTKAICNLKDAWADLIKAFQQEWATASDAIVNVLKGPGGHE